MIFKLYFVSRFFEHLKNPENVSIKIEEKKKFFKKMSDSNVTEKTKIINTEEIIDDVQNLFD